MVQPATEIRACVAFDAQIANLAPIRAFVMAGAEAVGFPQEASAEMIQAVDEAATNIIRHGYRRGEGQIEVELQANKETLVVRLCDDAPAFDPTSIPAPDLDLPWHLRRPGGLGVHLMREFVDRLSYRRTDAGQNELTLEIAAAERTT
jgi:anti-sigma regulatory factor (Ser/Thr protein kinase)